MTILCSQRSNKCSQYSTPTRGPKSWTGTNNSLKAIWGREVASTDALTAAGPPRDDSRPSGMAHRDPYQVYALSAWPLEGS